MIPVAFISGLARPWPRLDDDPLHMSCSVRARPWSSLCDIPSPNSPPFLVLVKPWLGLCDHLNHSSEMHITFSVLAKPRLSLCDDLHPFFPQAHHSFRAGEALAEPSRRHAINTSFRNGEALAEPLRRQALHHCTKPPVVLFHVGKALAEPSRLYSSATLAIGLRCQPAKQHSSVNHIFWIRTCTGSGPRPGWQRPITEQCTTRKMTRVPIQFEPKSDSPLPASFNCPKFGMIVVLGCVERYICLSAVPACPTFSRRSGLSICYVRCA